MIKIDIPDPANVDNVIHLEVVREGLRAKQFEKVCLHRRTRVDTEFTTLKCLDCNESLNPVEWIATRIEFYHWMSYERQQLIEARATYEAKKRCRCTHCGKITPVKPATAAEVREFRAGTKQDEGKAKV